MRILLALIATAYLFSISGCKNVVGVPTDVIVPIKFTAPGDDAYIGTATEYVLKYSNQPITDANWNDAIRIDGVPSPSIAGTLESFNVTISAESEVMIYFGTKTLDEAGNISEISNIPVFITADMVSPGKITDMVVG